MTNYKNAKVYKVVNKKTGDIVSVDVTTETLCRRFYKLRKLKKFSHITDWSELRIIHLADIPSESRSEITKNLHSYCESNDLLNKL